ncbi:hypothetical protein JCM12296A_17240 [Desulfosarcina cetonica]
MSTYLLMDVPSAPLMDVPSAPLMDVPSAPSARPSAPQIAAVSPMPRKACIDTGGALHHII